MARRVAIAIFLCLALGACLGASTAAAGNPGPFSWLVPAPAPAAWKQAKLPAGGAVLSYPPSFGSTGSDSRSVSVATHDKSGTIRLYLNATPQQGGETLANWATFRISHNKLVSDKVRKHAAAVGLHFRGAKGSCVIDDYYSRVHVHHYHEIACIVQGRTTISVVVAAALESDWATAAPLLERAVSAYRAL